MFYNTAIFVLVLLLYIYKKSVRKITTEYWYVRSMGLFCIMAVFVGTLVKNIYQKSARNYCNIHSDESASDLCYIIQHYLWTSNYIFTRKVQDQLPQYTQMKADI